MFFQSVSAEVDGSTCDKDSNGKIKVKDGGIGATQFANVQLSLLGDTTASGGESYIEFTGLDSDTDGGYLAIFSLSPTVSGGSRVTCYANGDDTDTNYVYSRIAANNQNGNSIGDNNNELCSGFAVIQVNADGKLDITAMVSQRDDGDSDIIGCRSDSALASNQITSLRFDILTAGGTFDAGSRVQLYALKET